MTDVFVSYKREDEKRVARLVTALEKSGLSVWWDRSLPGAENWREGITKALAKAKCVVVVWTEASTGSLGSFVRDEANRAAKAGRLVPVCLDAVEVPLGFGELQAIDLRRWKGRTSDPFFQDLLAAVRAKMEGRPVPKPQGRSARLRRRILGMLGTVGLALLGAFASNTLKVQDRVCAAGVLQPALGDMCGELGLGTTPSKKERLSWESRAPGSCADIRKHLAAFEKGALRDQARALLDARTVTIETSWREATAPMPLRITVLPDGVPQKTEELARADAEQRGARKGDAMCRDADASGVTRLKSAAVEPQEWNCDRTSAGVVCGFEGRVLCSQEELVKTEREQCGARGKP